jgi:small subunit ribosomal protein S9
MVKEKQPAEAEKKEKKTAATKEVKEKKVAVKKDASEKKETTKKKPAAKKKGETTEEATGTVASEVAPISEETKRANAKAMNEMFGLVGYEDDEEDAIEIKYDENSTAYFVGTGRRKTSVARVRLYTKGDKTITVNGRGFEEYFNDTNLQKLAISSLDKVNLLSKFRISIVVNGGGVHSQAEAVRHGISRALTVLNPEFRRRLRKLGYLTRDQRMKERKKFGLKRARRAPQWSKR